MFLLQLLVVPFILAIKNFHLKLYTYIPIIVLLQLSIYSVGLYSCYTYSLPPASALVVSCEMARMSMKLHSYFREKLIHGILQNPEIEKFIPEWAQKQGLTEQDLNTPDIRIRSLKEELCCYLYFHFSPTLIYRDYYPRSRHIRINFLMKNIITFSCIICYLWCIFKSLCIPIFKHTVNNPGGPK